MAGETETMADRQQRLERAIAAYLEAADAGRAPDPGPWLARYRDLQPELGQFLADQAHLDGLVGPLRPAAAGGEGDAPTQPLSGMAKAPPETRPATGEASGPAGPTTERPPGPPPDGPEPPPGDGDGAELPRGARVRYFGDYELRAVLGKGGMGVVYRARQLSLNRAVALKMIKAGVLADDAELRRFQNEAEAVAALDHPGIVPIHEVGEHQGQRYFSMKLVDGGSLAASLDRYRDDPRAAARLVEEVARAVHHAHIRGILHRDLKPANILVDEQGRPHVTDFGLARKVEGDSELTQSGAIMGTPGYMAPEQAEGRRRAITTATDVYGLGAVLYAVLTGHAPFEGDSVVEVLDQVRHRPPQRPSALNSRVGRDLEVICLKCLEKDPGRRYDSAAALADDLGRYLRGEPILARPVGSWTRAAMWCRRKPGLAGLIAALLVALLGGFAGVTWQWREAVHQRKLLAIEQVKTAGERDQKEGQRRAAEAARQEAQARLGLAQEAIRTYYTGVSQDMLLKEPQMKSLRDKLLSTALEFYKRLQESLQGNPDPKAQADLAKAYYNLGKITGDVGSRKDSEKAFRLALAIRERLAAAEPANDDHQRAIAIYLGYIGDRRRALAIYERLAAAHPDNVQDQIALAITLSAPLTAEDPFDGNAAILRELRRNQQRLERLSRAYNDVHDIRYSLAFLCNFLAMYESGQREYEASLNSLDRGRRALEDLTTTPTPSDRFVLCRIYDNIAGLLVTLGRHAEANAARRKGLELGEGLVAEFPAVTTYRVFLVLNLHGLGDMHLRAGLLDEARKVFQRSRTILEDLPQSFEINNDLVTTDLSLGRVEVAQGRPAAAAEYFGRAVRALEEQVIGANESWGDAVILKMVRGLIHDACDPLVEVRGPTEPILKARAHFERLDREGRLKPMARQVLVWLDIRIAKGLRQAGQSAEARQTMRRIEAEMEIFRGVGAPSFYPFNLACTKALLSTLVGQPGVEPSPAERAEIRHYQDEAIADLRLAFGMKLSQAWVLDNHDLDSLRSRPDFQALLLDSGFPADPFVP
jgi:tetratricopeptide (TPR) repeat protein/predicted Ser/Thr protein kinase